MRVTIERYSCKMLPHKVTWAGSWKESFPIRSVLLRIHLESFLQNLYVTFDDYTSIANIQKNVAFTECF